MKMTRKMLKTVKAKSGNTRTSSTKTAVTATRKSVAKKPTAIRSAPKTTAPKKAGSKLGQVITGENIAARAYHLWEQAGRPHGRDGEFWLLAEQQLKESSFAA